jgi:adenylylsulfate kinase
MPSKQRSFVLWFTGLSGSGKSTLADAIYRWLKKKGLKVERLDGDSVRAVFPQTGFDREARNEHIRRIGYLTSILERNGIIVIASFISPYRESRDFVRKCCKNFIEIHVDAPVEVCEQRDTKGLYHKARIGELQNFTGVNDPYEEPRNPELVVVTENKSVRVCVSEIMAFLKKRI